MGCGFHPGPDQFSLAILLAMEEQLSSCLLLEKKVGAGTDSTDNKFTLIIAICFLCVKTKWWIPIIDSASFCLSLFLCNLVSPL